MFRSIDTGSISHDNLTGKQFQEVGCSTDFLPVFSRQALFLHASEQNRFCVADPSGKGPPHPSQERFWTLTCARLCPSERKVTRTWFDTLSDFSPFLGAKEAIVWGFVA